MIWDHAVYTLLATQKINQALQEVRRDALARQARPIPSRAVATSRATVSDSSKEGVRCTGGTSAPIPGLSALP